MRKGLSLYFFLLLTSSLYAQSVRVLNLKDGLSNNYVQCILQDKAGYMWIGTRDGLNRFDGYHTQVYKDDLLSSFIYSLMQDSKGRIWIGTSYGGISLYDPEKETFHSLLNDGKKFSSLHDKDVYTMFEDASHDYWLGTLQGLAHIKNSMDTIVWFTESHNGFDLSFTSILEDNHRTKWLGTNRGLFTLQQTADTTFRVVPSSILPKVFIRDIKADKKYNLWIATDENGIFKIDSERNNVKNYPSLSKKKLRGNQTWKLFIDSKENLWVALINGGIYRYDASLDEFIDYQPKISKTFNAVSITDITEDFNGNLWITSHGDGACYFNPNRYVFETFLNRDGFIVSSFLEEKNGNVLIGTDGAGLKEIDSKNSIRNVLTEKDGLSSNSILDILEDDAGGKWLATWQGGVDYIPANSQHVTVFNQNNDNWFALKSSNVKSLLKDKAGNIWMVTHGNGIFIYSTKQKKFIDQKSVIPAFMPDVAQWGSDILQSSNGDIWIASHAGLAKYTGDTVVRYYPNDDPYALPSAIIYCVYESSDGTIWLGTNTSLEKYLPDKDGFENYSKKYGVPGDVKCITEDRQGHLWISTINEIIELDPKNNSIKHFDKSYNIQQGQFYECSCMKSSKGKLYFGGTEGFNAFYPDSLSDDDFKSRVFITDLYLFNKKQKPGDDKSILDSAISHKKSLVLDYAQNVVSFEFLAINYSSSNKNYYQYKMEGFDKDWNPTSEARMATYTNLDPGTYTFRVKNVSINGATLSETSLRLKIIPPFWKTVWFKILATFIVSLAVIGVFYIRLQASRKKRLILQQLVRERTKEVSDKNILLEKQKEDLQKKNDALVAQEAKIREQANTLSEQKEQLQRTNLSLEDLNATKDRLFSIIAHDLRNPFTSLLGFSRLLNDEFDRYTDEEKQKLIRSLFHSSNSIYSLLENLLVWSKSQQNILMFAPEKLFLKSTINDHFDLIRDEAEKKNVSLRFKTDKEVTFFADRNMLSIIIRNLLSNALKYSPVNGTIEVSYELEGSTLAITVKDEGAGIEKGIKLFEVNPGDSRHRDHNHGLGLILCREFVEKHGGQISAANNQDKGARFTFTLPLSNASIVETDSNEIKIDGDNTNGSHISVTDVSTVPTVLLAEDEDDIRWYIKQTLFPDFQVIEAVNGADAHLIANEKNPDIIISDLTMPQMDGLAFCKNIKSNSQTSHIPFIMLTAERSNEAKVSGFQFGADDYITKPVEPNVLRARLHNILENRRRLKIIYQKDITAEPETFTNNAIDQSFLEKLNGIIENQISNPDLNPDHLAREMNMSRTGLYMKVKALTGESVGIYIRNIRLKASKKLLKERKLNISEVAYSVGFNQLPYFTTCFKEAFGITPSEFIAGKTGN